MGARVAVRLALYAAALAVGGAFGLLFEPAGGAATVWMLGAAAVGLAAGSAGSYRFVLLPPASVVYGVLAAYGPAALNPFGIPGLWAGLQRDLPQALETMYLQPLPYGMQPGLLLLLAPVVALLCGLAASATLYEEIPILSVAILGLSLCVISTLSFERGVGPYFALFLAAGMALLLLTGSGLAGIGGRGVAVAVVVVGAVLALPQTPLAEVAIRPALVDWTNLGTGGPSRLATQADVGDYLNSARDTELMIIRSPEPLLWRGGTLDKFDGARWSSTLPEDAPDGEEVAPGVQTETVRQRVKILSVRTDLVFGAYDIQDVSLPGAEPAADGSWSVDGGLTKGREYTVTSEVPQPTARRLSSAGRDYPDKVRSRYLQMPDDRPDEVAETAQRIRRDYSPANPYETARAIERYLRYDGGFTYNLNADYRRADQAIEQFLGDEREGFCTQFATSMALVAREMGIPSRVVYGAATGEEVREDTYLVRGANMHTWVEIYFPGVGWYPFDPTPGRGVTDAMQANAPAPQPSPSGGLQAQSPALRGDGSTAPPDTGPGGDLFSGPPESPAPPADGGPAPLSYALGAALAAAAALAATPLAKAALLRRGRPGDYYRDAVGRLEDALPGRGSLRDPSYTPTERLSALARQAGLEEEPFSRLGRAYSEHLYSPRPGSDVAAAHAEARRAYRRLPRRRRALGAMNPASLLKRGAALPHRLRKRARGRREARRR